MIKSFRDKDTERLFQRQFLRHFPPELHRLAWRKLVQLDVAERLDDLRIPPANRLERLSGDRFGQHSIRINDQWRICPLAGRRQDRPTTQDNAAIARILSV